mgnify:CR=1 FL=1
MSKFLFAVAAIFFSIQLNASEVQLPEQYQESIVIEGVKHVVVPCASPQFDTDIHFHQLTYNGRNIVTMSFSQESADSIGANNGARYVYGCEYRGANGSSFRTEIFPGGSIVKAVKTMKKLGAVAKSELVEIQKVTLHLSFVSCLSTTDPAVSKGLVHDQVADIEPFITLKADSRVVYSNIMANVDGQLLIQPRVCAFFQEGE